MSDTPSKDKPDSDSQDATIQEQRAEQPSDEVIEEQPLDLKIFISCWDASFFCDL